jgi:hypothetical protein
MVSGLLAYGEQLLAKKEVLEARRILRLAGYLVPQGDTRGARIRAHLAYLEGLRRRDLGFPDPEPFREAAQLDPAYARLIAQRGDLTALGGATPEPVTAASLQAPASAPAPPAAVRARVPAGRIAVAAGIALTALAALFLLVSYGRIPGRLFARGGRSPATSPPVAPSPPPPPPPLVSEPRASASGPVAERSAVDDRRSNGHVEPSPPEPRASASGQPPAEDPYLRIEQALARIRTDVPPPAPAAGDESRQPQGASPPITPDHDDDHGLPRGAGRKELGND